MRVRTGLLAMTSLLVACAAPSRPDRLGMPLLGGARLPDDWSSPSSAPAGDPRAPRDAAPARVATRGSAPAPRVPTATRPRVVPPAPGEPRTAPGTLVPCTDAATTLCDVQMPDGLDLAALPDRHQETRSGPAAALLAAVREAPDLRRMVGIRLDSDPLTFAVAVAARLTSTEMPTVVSGPDFLLWAQVRATVAEPTAAVVPGDLLVFDRAVGGAPASLVAVAVGRDPRGVTEMIYLSGGVVRRGFVDASRPRTVRDAERRIVNSFLRHGRDWPPEGTRFLAGELLARIVRLRA
jgi:hypothetical protein